MKILIFISAFGFLLSSCATTPQSEIDKYLASQAEKISPLWQADVRTRIKNLASRGLSPIAVPSPGNEIMLAVEIAPNGEIMSVSPITRSRYVFLNQSAVKAINDSAPLDPPPASCVKENICKVAWRFVVLK